MRFQVGIIGLKVTGIKGCYCYNLAKNLSVFYPCSKNSSEVEVNCEELMWWRRCHDNRVLRQWPAWLLLINLSNSNGIVVRIQNRNWSGKTCAAWQERSASKFKAVG